MDRFQISLMELSDIRESTKVLSIAMLNNPLHVALLKGNGENERLEIEKMFLELFQSLPGIVFLAKENDTIVGVMRMKSCQGREPEEEQKEPVDENDIDWRKTVWRRQWALNDPKEQHWHLGPIGVLPSHQGLGVGSRLMEIFCKEVDKCAAQAYLETDLDENVRFYEKFGFKLICENDIFDVNNRYMLRSANR